MKGKKLLSLLSILAGSAIVGTTFAGWAITDNADPFSVKVTPSSSSTDETLTATLAYGSTFVADNITNLKKNEPRLAAAVALRANTTSANTYTGKFHVELENLTTGKASGIAYLYEHLEVKMYSYDNGGAVEYNANKVVTSDLSERVADFVVPTTGEHPLVNSHQYTVTKNTDFIVYVVVSLDSTLSPAQLDQIQNDHVRINMDWGMNDGDTESSFVYYKAATAGAPYYCYAWNSSTLAPNRKFPGVEMTLEYALDATYSLYKYELGTQFDRVIFTDETGGEGHQTSDITVTTEARSTTPAYVGNAWAAKPSPSSLDKAWYVVGSFSDPAWKPLAANGMSPTTEGLENIYILEHLSLTANDEIKICDPSEEEWRTSIDWFGDGPAHKNFDNGNIVVETTGSYTIKLYPSGTNGNYVSVHLES
jgi:hypothetical protein